MSKWIELKVSPADGHYLCFCNDIVSSWQEVLCCWGGKWRDMCGKDFDPIITHYAKLPAPPEK